jgi:hypothetical protein
MRRASTVVTAACDGRQSRALARLHPHTHGSGDPPQALHTRVHQSGPDRSVALPACDQCDSVTAAACCCCRCWRRCPRSSPVALRGRGRARFVAGALERDASDDGVAWRGAVQCGVTRSWGLFADEGRSGWRAPRSRCCVFAVRVRPSSVSPPAGWVGGTTPGARQGNTAASQIKWPWFALPFCGWTQPLVAVARAKSIRGVRLGATGGPDGATPAGMASPPPLSTVPDASLIASQRTLFLGGLSWVTT